MSLIPKKLEVFVDIVKKISTLSHDNKHQVAAIIFPNDFSEITAIGYNGNARGLTHRRDSQESGKSGFIHAEMNCLLKAGLNKISNREDYVMITTLSPCMQCAKLILNSGLKTLVYLKQWEKAEGFDALDLLRHRGVRVSKWAE